MTTRNNTFTQFTASINQNKRSVLIYSIAASLCTMSISLFINTKFFDDFYCHIKKNVSAMNTDAFCYSVSIILISLLCISIAWCVNKHFDNQEKISNTLQNLSEKITIPQTSRKL